MKSPSSTTSSMNTLRVQWMILLCLYSTITTALITPTTTNYNNNKYKKNTSCTALQANKKKQNAWLHTPGGKLATAFSAIVFGVNTCTLAAVSLHAADVSADTTMDDVINAPIVRVQEATSSEQEEVASSSSSSSTSSIQIPVAATTTTLPNFDFVGDKLNSIKEETMKSVAAVVVDKMEESSSSVAEKASKEIVAGPEDNVVAKQQQQSNVVVSVTAAAEPKEVAFIAEPVVEKVQQKKQVEEPVLEKKAVLTTTTPPAETTAKINNNNSGGGEQVMSNLKCTCSISGSTAALGGVGEESSVLPGVVSRDTNVVIKSSSAEVAVMNAAQSAPKIVPAVNVVKEDDNGSALQKSVSFVEPNKVVEHVKSETVAVVEEQKSVEKKVVDNSKCTPKIRRALALEREQFHAQGMGDAPEKSIYAQFCPGE